MQTMGTSPGTCEIIELMEELDSAQDLKETNRLSCGVIMGNKDELFLVGTTAYKYTLDDDINKLFEAIDHRASARGLHTSRKWNTKSPSTKPISSSLSQASSIGISESVTLKQALRGLCISHASEIAAMKRLSELVVGSSYVSKAGSIKRMYRAVVVEADESGSPLNEGKGSSLELSIGPEQSKVDPFKNISLPETREKSMSPNVHSSPFKVASSTEVSMTEAPLKKIVPVSAEIVKRTPLWKLRQNGGLNSALSLSRLKSPNKTTKVKENFSASMETGSIKSMLKLGKNLKLNSLYSSFSSTAGVKVNTSSQNSAIAVNPVRKSECYLEKKIKEPDIRCTKTFSVDDNSGMCSSESQLTQNVAKVSPPALCSGCLKVDVSSSFADSRTNKSGFLLGGYSRRDMDGKASECSRSREPAEFSQSSKCSVGEFSNCTSVSEESNSCASSCSGSRAHMAKDFRWDAVHHVEMVHGSLGLKHFKLLKQLGSGDVGTVYLAELIGTGCLFAVKVMDTNSLGSRKKISRARTERDILQILDHPFLPTLYAHFTTNKYSVLVMEYCPGGDLHVLRQKQPGGTFTEQAARFYVAEILLALEYLHMLGIVYRDLKPENILIREDGHIMLSDFDLSLRCTVKPTLLAASSCTIAPTKKQSHPCMDFRCISDFCLKSSGVQVPCFTSRFLSTSNKRKMLKSNVAFQIPQILAEPTNARSNSFVGTHEYLAPEIIRGEGHGNAVDWWTFGIFLYELLFGVTPFKGFGDEETLSNVVMHSINFPANPSVSSQAKDLIKGLLVKEPQDRFGSVKGAAEIKKHPFFEGLNWALIRCAGPPLLPKSCDSGGLLLASVDSNPVERNKTMKEDTEFELF